MSRPFQVLVAEDEPSYSMAVAGALRNRGHEVTVCPTAETAEAALRESDWDALLLELKLGHADGSEVLAQVRQLDDHLQTVIVTGSADTDEVVARVENAAQMTRLARENRELRYQAQRQIRTQIVTCSPAVRGILATMEKVSAARTPVLIQGESGVGKELVAQYLHKASPRAQRTFVDLKCAAVAESVFESELFGHEKGAFTGATHERPGLVEVADGGTLFLDEVGEMPAESQARLLGILDSGTSCRIGATRKRRADFRLVAATNRGLKSAVAAGRFRQDLFDRLNGVAVVIPPLRERPEDIPLLVEHFARSLPIRRTFAPSALEVLTAYSWPGNVRELAIAVERIGRQCDSPLIEACDLPGEFATPAGSAPATPTRDRVLLALEKTRWHRGRAAGDLGVSARTLHRWMKRLGL